MEFLKSKILVNRNNYFSARCYYWKIRPLSSFKFPISFMQINIYFRVKHMIRLEWQRTILTKNLLLSPLIVKKKQVLKKNNPMLERDADNSALKQWKTGINIKTAHTFLLYLLLVFAITKMPYAPLGQIGRRRRITKMIKCSKGQSLFIKFLKIIL